MDIEINEPYTVFKVMLKKRGVAPFSKWENELPKIIFDPRFKVYILFLAFATLLLPTQATSSPIEQVCSSSSNPPFCFQIHNSNFGAIIAKEVGNLVHISIDNAQRSLPQIVQGVNRSVEVATDPATKQLYVDCMNWYMSACPQLQFARETFVQGNYSFLLDFVLSRIEDLNRDCDAVLPSGGIVEQLIKERNKVLVDLLNILAVVAKFLVEGQALYFTPDMQPSLCN